MANAGQSQSTTKIHRADVDPGSAHSLQRKAAILEARGIDHAGQVRMETIEDFDLNQTIFSTLEGRLPRLVMRAKIAKSVYWAEGAAKEIDAAYRASLTETPAVPIEPRLIAFMNDECDFAMEHADGTFMEHLLFCYEYGTRHYPEQSPNVLLLHSIMGTGTNTFAMEASKIPKLRELLTEFEMAHVEAFPSFLRLLYNLDLLAELTANAERLDKLESITFHRVIDNAELKMDADNLWVQLNFQLIHFLDFLPVANWSFHAADPLFQVFVHLFDFLDRTEHRTARVAFAPPSTGQDPIGEPRTLGGWIASVLPAGTAQKMAAKSIQKFSGAIGHSLAYRLEFSA